MISVRDFEEVLQRGAVARQATQARQASMPAQARQATQARQAVQPGRRGVRGYGMGNPLDDLIEQADVLQGQIAQGTATGADTSDLEQQLNTVQAQQAALSNSGMTESSSLLPPGASSSGGQSTSQEIASLVTGFTPLATAATQAALAISGKKPVAKPAAPVSAPMSTTTKVVLGVAAVGFVGGGIYLATRKKGRR